MSQKPTFSYADMVKRGPRVARPLPPKIERKPSNSWDLHCHCDQPGGWCFCGVDITAASRDSQGNFCIQFEPAGRK